jgi:hypothetical protein
MWFVLTENIINPENMDVLNYAGDVLPVRALEELRDEFGLDNVQATVCLTRQAADAICAARRHYVVNMVTTAVLSDSDGAELEISRDTAEDMAEYATEITGQLHIATTANDSWAASDRVPAPWI